MTLANGDVTRKFELWLGSHLRKSISIIAVKIHPKIGVTSTVAHNGQFFFSSLRLSLRFSLHLSSTVCDRISQYWHSVNVPVNANVISQQELLIFLAAFMIIVSQIHIQQILILYQFVIMTIYSARISSYYNCA